MPPYVRIVGHGEIVVVQWLVVLCVFMAILESFSNPLVVILDNASIHTAKKLKPYWDLLGEKGMRFYFLPPYSPELNRIELHWHDMKYEWLQFKLYTPDELEKVIDEIGKEFGDLYMLTFC